MELLVTVVILAILSAIAMPAYWQYVVKGRRTTATSTLQDIAAREESYFFSNNAYTTTSSALGVSSTAGAPFYSVTVASASSTAFTVTATPIGTQAKDTTCTQISINQAGQQMAQPAGNATTCWGSQ